MKYICTLTVAVILNAILTEKQCNETPSSIRNDYKQILDIVPDTLESDYQIVSRKMIIYDKHFHFSYYHFVDSVHRRESLYAGSYDALWLNDSGSPSYGKYQMKSISIHHVFGDSITVVDFMGRNKILIQEEAYFRYTLWHYHQLIKVLGYCNENMLHYASGHGLRATINYYLNK